MLSDPKTQSMVGVERTGHMGYPYLNPKKAGHLPSLKNLYSQKGPITAECSPEDCAQRLLPRTGSAEFQICGQRRKCCSLPEKLLQSGRHPKGDGGLTGDQGVH